MRVAEGRGDRNKITVSIYVWVETYEDYNRVRVQRK